jgi:hypothetical protein
MTSRALRSKVRSGVSRTFFTSCWVIVLALHDLARGPVRPPRAGSNTSMPLCRRRSPPRDEGEDDVLRDRLEAHEAPPLLEELADRLPVAVEDGGGQRGAVVVEPAQVRS